MHQAARNEAAAVSFPILVASLAYAKNLESFSLHGDALLSVKIMNEYGHSQSGLYPEFGRNLARCTRLKEVEIVNVYDGRKRD